ncbi:NACHT domain-containing protein [Kribbella sp. NPDC058693]|uniref:NACHT domain-containing protein n=1 Tax=Kribbella sp. NPDC058693 TaxID=3346602 RepID=UPI003651DA04
MSPHEVIGEFALGLVVNAVSRGAGMLAALLPVGEPVSEQTWSRGAVNLAVQAELEDHDLSPELLTRIGEFLRQSPEAQHLAEAALLVTLMRGDTESIQSKFRAEVRAALILTIAPHPNDMPAVAGAITAGLLAAARGLYGNAKSRFSRGTGDGAKSYLEQAANRELLAQALQSKLNLVDFAAFVGSYRNLVQQKTEILTLAQLDQQRSIRLQDVYVAPDLQAIDGGWDSVAKSDRLDLRDVFELSARTVVLGDPGAGKSTLIQHLMHETSSATEQNARVPFLVELRRYNDAKTRDPRRILDHIESCMAEDYQLVPPPGCIEWLLISGRAVVMFDGLDEVVNGTSRAAVKDSVLAFASLYAATPMVVTSRSVGYDIASLSRTDFTHFRILPFSDDQIRRYCESWFRIDARLTSQVLEQRVNSFVAESEEHAPDLRANPLMLSLLCAIYMGERSIPENRPELYEKCAALLFDRWDALRRIDTPPAFKADAKIALCEIALWIYQSAERQQGVTEAALVQRLTRFWQEQRLPDVLAAREAAQELVSLWRGRAWLITDLSSGPTSQPIFAFTHRTFLEYFAAVELVRRAGGPKELLAKLAPHLEIAEWEVIGEVSVAVLDSFQHRGAERFVLELCRRAGQSTQKRRYMLTAFALRLREFGLLTPRAVERLTSQVLRTYLQSQNPGRDYREIRAFSVRWSYWEDRDLPASSEDLPGALKESLGKVAGDPQSPDDISPFHGELLLLNLVSQFPDAMRVVEQLIEELWELINKPDVQRGPSYRLFACLPALVRLAGRPTEDVVAQTQDLISKLHAQDAAESLYDSGPLTVLAAVARGMTVGDDVLDELPWQLFVARDSILVSNFVNLDTRPRLQPLLDGSPTADWIEARLRAFSLRFIATVEDLSASRIEVWINSSDLVPIERIFERLVNETVPAAPEIATAYWLLATLMSQANEVRLNDALPIWLGEMFAHLPSEFRRLLVTTYRRRPAQPGHLPDEIVRLSESPPQLVELD